MKNNYNTFGLSFLYSPSGFIFMIILNMNYSKFALSFKYTNGALFHCINEKQDEVICNVFWNLSWKGELWYTTKAHIDWKNYMLTFINK